MITCSDINTTLSILHNERKQNQRIALVPTMGNLHAGHLSLIETAKANADKVVVSIFVNPAQFGPNEDYAQYPRTLDEDCKALTAAGVDLLFTPEAKLLYPEGTEAHTSVKVPGLSEGLCSNTRPQFLQGVTTIVCKLFNLIQPDIAVFGEKDYQQLRCVQKMVHDLCMPIEVIGVPTKRESNGLAMSSRNQYLLPEQRKHAALLYQSLCALVQKLQSRQASIDDVEQETVASLNRQGFISDYVSVRTQADLKIPSTETELVVLAAAYLGSTRLIDNISFTLDR